MKRSWILPALFAVILLTMSVIPSSKVNGASPQTEISSSTASRADEYRLSLKKKVSVNISKGPGGGRLTVQFAVIAICEAVGVPYQWEKSKKLANTKVRNFTKPVHVNNIEAEKVLQTVLGPVRLTFEVNEGGLYLTQAAKTKGRGRKVGSVRESAVEQRLASAREALRGKNKNIPLAKRILTGLAEKRASELKPIDRCYVYVYLGYIEDLAGNREAAIGWFKQALSLEAPNIKNIQQLAEIGMTKPVTWIHHLDAGSQSENQYAWKKEVIERIGKGFVTRVQPSNDFLPKMNLSKAERMENFDTLWKAIDRTYSFFDHKDINWQEIRKRYQPKVEAVKSTKEFYHLLYQFVRELKDCHSWLCNYKENLELARFSPEVSICMIDGKAVIANIIEGSEAYEKGLLRGFTIIEVDGLKVEEKIEKLRPLLRMSSSERNFLDSAYRRLLDGEKGSNVTVKFLPLAGKVPISAKLKRTGWRKEQTVQPNFPVSKGKFIWSGIHPSGYGYIRILSFSGRMEIAEEFDLALEKLKETPAIIIDIRDNKGGFGTAQPRIVGRFISKKTKVSVSYKKSGHRHKDFAKHETYFVPTGDWQYNKPFAFLINAGTGSAADLFACYMISTSRPITIGTTTHGNLTGVGVYVVLPCDLVVRVSNGYVCDTTGKIIEGNGNVPRIHAELTINDVIDRTDSVLERAVKELQRN